VGGSCDVRMWCSVGAPDCLACVSICMHLHRLYGITMIVFSPQVLAVILVFGPALHFPIVMCVASSETA
jgi:hypothetical protein